MERNDSFGSGSFPVCKRPLKWMVMVVVVIIIYFIGLVIYNRSRHPNGDKSSMVSQITSVDFMNKKLFSVPWNKHCCSVWPISHFILYAILGFFFPTCFWWLMLFGVLWEGMESVAAKISSIGRHKLVESDGTVQYSDNWWGASGSDIFFNAIGFGFGWMIYKMTR